jgi:hypothetical protein
MTQTQPQFTPGQRVFTHYDMKWGTVERINTTYRDQTHGVTGSKLPDTTWYDVKYDGGGTSLLDDAHGNWDMARIVPPHIAKRYGYGDDPNPTGGVAIRLEYLRGELRAERISQGELIELQGLAEHIEPGDVELLEAAGVPEHVLTDKERAELMEEARDVEEGRRERREFYRNRDY